MAKFRLVVTVDDIEQASYTPANCPVARSLTRRGFRKVAVFPTNFSFALPTNTTILRRVWLPPDVTSYIECFDIYHTVGPKQFLIDIPAQYLP